ncbi:MAG TPA: CARDB domain-containing protein [Herpetosiphonaceae bacterium]
MHSRFRRSSAVVAMMLIIVLLVGALPIATFASTPTAGSLNPPAGNGSSTVTWSGGPYTIATPDPALCLDASLNCDTFDLTLNIPANYWDTHEGNVSVEIAWSASSDDFDLYIEDSAGNQVGSSAAGGTTSEKADLGKLAPGTYTVRVVAYLAAAASYTGKATLTSTELAGDMAFPESKATIQNLLTVDYPLNVIFVGYKPTAAEVAELKSWIPDTYQPTIATKSPGGDELQNTGAALLNWNKNHLTTSEPYFLGIRYNYKLRIIQASDDYAKALFQVAKDNTAQAQSFHVASRGQDLLRYDTLYGHYRLLAKNGDLGYKVLDAQKTDLIDAYAVEDWIFNSRYDTKWSCAFKNAETNECFDPSIIQPDPNAYHDPYYDKNGLNLDRMPQGLNKGSSFFFLDTFTPDYARNYFRTNAYHTWGTDKVINGGIVAKPIEEGGSWRITDPDTKDWDGVDFARTWGGRYRFHFIDLGAAPNNYESASWLRAERTLSSDYPFGDPPIWQYKADPLWQQTADACLADPQVLDYTGGTPCRMMPRLGRDVAYGLFFRSTSGYLYRPIPRGDVYWLAVSNWTDFYSRPQWINGQLTNAPWYGLWWTNMEKLYKINQVGNNNDDTMRWLSSALPYARWVGRKGEVIPLYDPTNNQPTGEMLDTSPKYEDLPAPKYHVHQSATGLDLVPEPLYPGDDQHVHVHYGDSTVDLTEVSNALEKAKAQGLLGTYDDSVNHEAFRDFIDANREGIADQVPGVNTIPSINMVFEKAYTWALPAIVGGIAVGTADGEAWGVMNNVNDRVKWSQSHYPAAQPGDAPGSKRSVLGTSLPTQDTGGGFSYTIEHEAAHNLGLSHPHDGSYGVDKCKTGPNAGKWACYWSGLGWMYDIAAAPTTYAMSYRPYEVEDQDNLQRGHVAEYLLGAQDALRTRLVEEARAGRTTPSTQWSGDFNRMKQWRAQAADLFKQGDYLHAEYAARNAALAARGIPQTASNTSDPKLVEAGQIFYFNVKPQAQPAAKADLTITNLVASQARPKETVLTATIANTGAADAKNVVVRFKDGATLLGDSAAIATLAKGATQQVTFTWNTKSVSGDHVISAQADPANLVDESNESNNAAQRTITIRGNRVTNGSFEQSTSGSAPDGWSGSQGTGYDTGGANASDGTRAISLTGSGGAAALLNPAWTSAPIAVTPGQTYNLAMTIKTQSLSSAPSLQITYLDAAGTVLNKVSGIATTITGSSAAQQVLGQIVVPAGVSQVRVTLIGFSPLDTATRGTVWIDDVWLW